MRTLFIALLLVFFTRSVNAQEPGAELPRSELDPVAEKSLDTFARLVTNKTYRMLGFRSLTKAKEATKTREVKIGTPIKEYIIRLDQLAEYKGGNATKLLVGGDTAVYPIVVNGTTNSSMTLTKAEQSWKTVSFGNMKQIRLISNIRDTTAVKRQIDKKTLFLVRIPAMNLYFLGQITDGTLLLTPLIDNPGLQLKAGESTPAEHLFIKLAPIAKKHNGLPT